MVWITRFLKARRRRRESGFLVVWMGMLLTSLLVSAALVVDIGYGRQARRQTQSAADASALGAVQSLPALSAAESQAQSLAATNLAGGSSAWDTCVDQTPLAIVGTTPCISYDTSFTTVRVKVPTQTFPTLFGPIASISSLSTNGVATARLVHVGLGAVLPFALYSGAGDEACLKASSNGTTQNPLCESATGNFGPLDIWQYGNATMQTPSRCAGADQERFVNNTALGVDHLLTTYSDPPGELLDACGTPGPNTVPTMTGNIASMFDRGMLHATAAQTDDGAFGRLARGAYPKATVAGTAADNKPLWEFIPNVNLLDVPGSCQRATFNALISSTPVAQQQTVLHAALATCFSQYRSGTECSSAPCTGTLFGASSWVEAPYDLYDIQLSPRFGYVPRFAEPVPPNGTSTPLKMVGFKPVFLQRLYGKCNNDGCGVDFEPGPWNTGSLGQSNDSVISITSFVIHPNMLPNNVEQPYAFGETVYAQLIG